MRALELFDQYGDREALGSGDHVFTFTELRAAVLDLAGALREHGVRAGMPVAVAAMLPAEGIALQLALHLLGCRVVWVLLGAGSKEQQDYLDVTAPELFIYDPRDEAELGRELAAHLGPVPVLCLGPGGLGPDLLAERPQWTSRPDPTGLAGPNPESVHQTSGTTGRPKALLLTDDCFQQMLVLAESWTPAGNPRLRHLTVTPLWWSAGTVMAMITLGSGGTLFLMHDWEPAEFLRLVERHRINYMFMSPPMFYELLDHPMAGTTDFSSMTMLNVGAAPVAPERLRQSAKLFGPVARIAYGLSECPYVAAYPAVTDDPAHPHRLSSCGTAWGDVRIEIRAEDGAVLGPGEDGEVWVASRLNFAGYVGQPELTAETLVDGWLRTRDIGHLDQDGYLYLVGRTQDSIVTGRGSRLVFARPIEDILSTHPGVRAAAVIGVPDPVLVEVVHAYVVPDGDRTPTLAELRRLVTDQLPEIWAPRSVDFVPNLPLVGIGKVDKRSLRERYATEHAGTPG
ncbi:MAG TPA: AMP-binding protein [Actinophytocola sp.]|uniref:AMP-binding protein n=1 Tax=Actinophytocola sp. TaxID=1872138 RepID=UPI002DBE115E|nr:AMP-binding protein [Actinophytocola sp.]HEU5469129.1 AMP-binding protein [Actinophytocola sp.]